MYVFRPRPLPDVAAEQLEALDRRWRLAAQQETFRNNGPETGMNNPYRPPLPHRRQRPPT